MLQAKNDAFCWNEGQTSALNAPRRNLLVSAAAGSGKTAVLTERIFRLLTDEKDPIPFSEIVAITFTRAAAASLKEKLSRRIDEAIASDPKNALYRRLSLELPHAAISTVHSFCMRIIRENTARLSLPQGLTLADEATCDRMQKSAMRRALNAVFDDTRKRDDSMQEALSTVFYLITSEKKHEITDLPLKLYHQLMALEEGVSKLDDLTREAKADLAAWEAGKTTFFGTPAGRLGREQATLLLRTLNGRIETYLAAFPEEEQALLLHAHALRDSIRVAASVLEDGDFERFSAFARNFTPERYTNKTKSVPTSSPLGKLLKDFYNNKIKTPFVNLCGDYDQNVDKLLSEEARRIRVQEIFCEILTEFDALYRREKLAAALLDYSDLEHYALKVLRTAETPYCRALFVDEYQDTNRLQDTIFRACTQNGGFFFFVGDVKQSIYRFRYAAPELFLSYKNNFPDLHAEDVQDAPLGKSVFLSENFRSDRGVIDFANRVFSVLMNDNTQKSERLYAEKDHLKKGKLSEKDEPVEFLLLDRKTDPDSKLGEEALIAERVLSLIHKEGRAPEEIAVIAYTNTFLIKLRKSFLKAGIPVNQANAELMDAVETEGLTAILKTLHNPLSDIPLASLCTSKLFSLSSDELLKLRAYSQGTLWDALVTASDASNLAPIAESARKIVHFVTVWREKSRRMPLSEFLLALLHRGGVLAALSYGEDKRRESLLKLYREAQTFEQGSRRTLGEFLNYLKSRREQSTQAESDTEVHKGYVTLMTVHKSKGLEFPVCIFAQLGRQTRRENGLFLDLSRGIYHRLYDADRHAFSSTLADKIARREENEACREEAKRLLYVGITRAAEKLILIDGKDTDTAKRFSECGVFPHLPEECIHSHDLLAPSNLLFYSLRDDEALKTFGEGFLPDSASRQTVVCPTYRLSVIGHDTLLSPENALEKLQEHSAPAPCFSAEDAERLAAHLKAYERRTEEEFLPSKLSVSELLHLDASADEEHATHLSFRAEDRSGARRGTAMHAFMQFCDFAAAKANVETEASRLAEFAFLSEEQAKDLNFYALARFFDSETFAEIEKSPRIKRELRFNVFLPIRDVLALERDGDVLIQGVIDCFYEKEDGTYAILDFKTDAVNEQTGEQILLARHRKQLLLYAKALKELTGKDVSSAALYSFALARKIEVPLTEAL